MSTATAKDKCEEGAGEGAAQAHNDAHDGDGGGEDGDHRSARDGGGDGASVDARVKGRAQDDDDARVLAGDLLAEKLAKAEDRIRMLESVLLRVLEATGVSLDDLSLPWLPRDILPDHHHGSPDQHTRLLGHPFDAETDTDADVIHVGDPLGSETLRHSTPV